MFEKLNDKSVNKGLHWTTIASEKVLLAIIGISTCIAAALYCYEMFLARQITLPDLFMLFIYAEILGMVGAFYSTSRIPVTLPIIIAITASNTRRIANIAVTPHNSCTTPLFTRVFIPPTSRTITMAAMQWHLL